MAAVRKPNEVDLYIAQFPEKTQLLLDQLRATIRKVIPDGVEGIKYSVPCFMLGKKNVIYFAGFKNHVSVYPAPRHIDEFARELAKYPGGKGTVQFALDQKIPVALVTRIAKYWKKKYSS